MAVNYIYPEFEIVRDADKCIGCRVCERQCSNNVHRYDAGLDKMFSVTAAFRCVLQGHSRS